MNISGKAKKYTGFFLVITFLLIWTVVILTVGAKKIVEYIGVDNGYILAFVIAVIGGVSSFTSTTYYATIITLAAGGLNPITLGMLAGIGLTISDTIFFYLGSQGRGFFEEFFEKHNLNKFSEWLQKQNFFMVSLIVFLYTAISFLPTDLLMIVLAVARYPFLRILPFIFIGNIAGITFVAYIASIS